MTRNEGCPRLLLEFAFVTPLQREQYNLNGIHIILPHTAKSFSDITYSVTHSVLYTISIATS